MKLTPKQVENVHGILVAMMLGTEMKAADLRECANLLDSDSKARSDVEFNAAEEREVVLRLKHAVAMVEAYHRVSALAENYDTMTVLDQSEHRRNMQISASIRRALYGEE